MPYVNLRILKNQVSENQKNEIVEGLTDLISTIMGRDRNFTVITIDEVEENNWIIGGLKLTPSELKSRIVSFVNIKVSKGTTNPVEIEKMIKETKKLFIRVLGNYDITNYFIVDELNPDLWGFDEISMTERNKMETK